LKIYQHFLFTKWLLVPTKAESTDYYEYKDNTSEA